MKNPAGDTGSKACRACGRRTALLGLAGIAVLAAGGYLCVKEVARSGRALADTLRYRRPPALPADLDEVRKAPFASLVGLAPGSAEAQRMQRAARTRGGLALEARTRKTGIRLRLIPAGRFSMGSPAEEAKRDRDEGPARPIAIAHSFYMGTYEVTQEEWKRVLGDFPSFFSKAGPSAPVEQVSWLDAQKFLNRLCVEEGVPEGAYRLPTEEEWEYACRAGTDAPYCYGPYLESTMANFDGNWPYNASKGPFRRKTVPVSSFAPNAWGLYDMHGNVWEWCQDWYALYPAGTSSDSKVDTSAPCRVCRGGSWYESAKNCRSAYRSREGPDIRKRDLGFRIVRELVPTGHRPAVATKPPAPSGAVTNAAPSAVTNAAPVRGAASTDAAAAKAPAGGEAK